MRTAGIDIGSITAKAAVMEDGMILGSRIIFTGYNTDLAGRKVFEELIKELGIETASIGKIVSTGYGRSSVKFARKTATEIICHAAGALLLDGRVKTVIDIGGQDSKAISIDGTGKIKNFVMNDKCAAGTGRFLEVMARALGSDLDEFGSLSLKADRPSRISSLCTVFAESEVISLISKGETRENIIAGIHESIAARVSAMAARIGIVSPVMLTGGVARNIGVVKALEAKLGIPLVVSQYAQVMGAIGAAVIASRAV
ncbi:MAG TPA: acyl-CoA dehydratase activase [Syntrophales bacterium]|nr:acyl-CoA dehydratase activase [Syntrophales bacterium]